MAVTGKKETKKITTTMIKRKPAATTKTAVAASGSVTTKRASTSSNSPRKQVQATDDQIAARAWEIWQSEGCPAGREVEHWVAAERELCACACG